MVVKFTHFGASTFHFVSLLFDSRGFGRLEKSAKGDDWQLPTSRRIQPASALPPRLPYSGLAREA
jgi:hypothetical protein